MAMGVLNNEEAGQSSEIREIVFTGQESHRRLRQMEGVATSYKEHRFPLWTIRTGLLWE